MQNMFETSDYMNDFSFEDEFLETLRKKGYREGIEGLMLAVLQDAVDCYQKFVTARSRKGQRLFSEAEEWILDDGTDWPFSFVTICEVLGLDPQYLREGLARWKATKLSEDGDGKYFRPPVRKNVSEEDRRSA